MRVALVQVEEVATPVVALVTPAGLYEVAALEEHYRMWCPCQAADFHTRVVACRGAGLDELAARLEAGPRPPGLRLAPGDYLPLPPCDVERSGYLEVRAYQVGQDPPALELRSSRALVGDAQPATVSGSRLVAEVGLAVVLGEDLHRASFREAQAAVLGTTLAIAWRGEGPVSAQLGPSLILRRPMRDLASLEVRVEHRGRSIGAGRVGDWAHPPAAAVAFASHQLPLRAGDVVGLGPLPGGTLEVEAGETVEATLHPLLRLTGRASLQPGSDAWRG
ncbi:MAG: fumarylacetoacetate hydrolase family protein [Polyangiaceae bacterium]